MFFFQTQTNQRRNKSCSNLNHVSVSQNAFIKVGKNCVLNVYGELRLAICFTYGNMHVSVLFSQIIPPSPSPIESKCLFFISVSFLMSCM